MRAAKIGQLRLSTAAFASGRPKAGIVAWSPSGSPQNYRRELIEKVVEAVSAQRGRNYRN